MLSRPGRKRTRRPIGVMHDGAAADATFVRMNEMTETVRRVANALLDTQIAYEPEHESENAVDLTTRNLITLDAAVKRMCRIH